MDLPRKGRKMKVYIVEKEPNVEKKYGSLKENLLSTSYISGCIRAFRSSAIHTLEIDGMVIHIRHCFRKIARGERS